MSWRRDFERYLIFVVVALIVATESNEDGKLVVGEIGDILRHGIGVYKHLESFVESEVFGGVFVYTLRLSRTQVVDNDVECLFVALHELWLCGVLHT